MVKNIHGHIFIIIYLLRESQTSDFLRTNYFLVLNRRRKNQFTDQFSLMDVNCEYLKQIIKIFFLLCGDRIDVNRLEEKSARGVNVGIRLFDF